MSHKVLAIAASPRRNGNSESLLDRAIEGVAAAAPDGIVEKVVLNDLKFIPCQNCGFCLKKGYCRFAEKDDMKRIFELLDECDRFVVATPIFFASVTAQLKAMIDRCQAIWARKYLLEKPHANPDRKALALCCGGFEHDRFYKCTRQVIAAWCVCLDIKLAADLFYPLIDARGDIQKHPSALTEAFDAGRNLVQ